MRVFFLLATCTAALGAVTAAEEDVSAIRKVTKVGPLVVANTDVAISSVLKAMAAQRPITTTYKQKVTRTVYASAVKSKKTVIKKGKATKKVTSAQKAKKPKRPTAKKIKNKVHKAQRKSFKATANKLSRRADLGPGDPCGPQMYTYGWRPTKNATMAGFLEEPIFASQAVSVSSPLGYDCKYLPGASST